MRNHKNTITLFKSHTSKFYHDLGYKAEIIKCAQKMAKNVLEDVHIRAYDKSLIQVIKLQQA